MHATAPAQNILLIDDDAISREVTATLLSIGGFTVETAAGGEAALELLAPGRSAPALILMDAQMPGLHGRELIRRLRMRSQAPIAVISGSQPAEDVAAAADEVLLKPFTPEAVRILLKRGPSQESVLKLSQCEKAGDAKAPVIDPEVLAQFREMMPEAAVRQVYGAVVADLHRRAEALETALQQGDCDEIRRNGHSIKGGCGMAGALEAAQLGARIEEGAGNQLDNSEGLLRDLRKVIERLERMLEAEFRA